MSQYAGVQTHVYYFLLLFLHRRLALARFLAHVRICYGDAWRHLTPRIMSDNTTASMVRLKGCTLLVRRGDGW